jgi:cobalt-zinc-cadmium resistance protein CzcA
LRRGENPKTVLSAIHEAVDQVNRELLPPGMKIVPFYDRTKLVEKTLKTVSHNMLEGIGLIPATLLTMLVLPAMYHITDRWFGSGWRLRHPESPEVP